MWMGQVALGMARIQRVETARMASRADLRGRKCSDSSRNGTFGCLVTLLVFMFQIIALPSSPGVQTHTRLLQHVASPLWPA